MSMEMVAQVRDFSKSRGDAKFLLLIIASHIHYKAAYAYPSLDTLTRETTLSKPTVIKLICLLEALGELEVLRGHGRGHSNRYRITIAHEVPDERSDEEEDDQAKGKAHERPLAPDDPAEGSKEDGDDQPKGKPYLYLLPTPTEGEKVNATPEKVNDAPQKGKLSLNSKEVFHTVKENTERVAFAPERKKVNDPGTCELEKRETASPFWCAACGYSTPTCAHRVLEVARSTPTGAMLRSAPAKKEMRR